MMKLILALSAIMFSHPVMAQMTSMPGWIAEASVLHLTQENDGETTTVLPMLGIQVWKHDNFEVHSKLGFTLYKNQSTDKTFGVGVLHLNPSYQLSEKKWSLEAVLGIQYWEEGTETIAEFGARMNYDITIATNHLLGRVFLGATTINTKEKTIALALGISKDF